MANCSYSCIWAFGNNVKGLLVPLLGELLMVVCYCYMFGILPSFFPLFMSFSHVISSILKELVFGKLEPKLNKN